MNGKNSKDLELLWKFISGDMHIPEFEKFLYTNDNLENILGYDFYLEVIAIDFRCIKYQIPSLKEKLEIFLLEKFPSDCKCITLSEVDIVDMWSDKAQEIFSTLEKVKRYGESRWWLSLELCNKCDQYWLVASEEQYNGFYYYKRITDKEAENIIFKDS